MSAVDAPERAAARPARRVPGRFLASELRLVAVRRRNQVGLLVLVAVPVIIGIAVRLGAPAQTDQPGGPEFLTGILNSGFFVALAALSAELPLFLPLAVATLAGDAVAGEANIGTLRYLLAVPAGRSRLLAVKYAGIVAGAFLAPLLVAGVGLLVGVALFGVAPVTLLSGAQVSFGAGLLRLLGVCLYLGICLSAVGAVGLFVSTLTEQPMGAAIGTTAVAVLSFVLLAVPQVDWLHPYQINRHWQDFGELMRDPVSFGALMPGLRSAGAYILVFLTAAWASLHTRDITS